jgi:hypothetical protein
LTKLKTRGGDCLNSSAETPHKAAKNSTITSLGSRTLFTNTCSVGFPVSSVNESTKESRDIWLLPCIKVDAMPGVEIMNSSLDTHSKTAFQVSCKAAGSVWHIDSNVFKASTFFDRISLGACKNVNLQDI